MSQPSVQGAVPKEVMDAFWKLGDAKDLVRLEAAQKIVAHAQSFKLAEDERQVRNSVTLQLDSSVC